MSALLTLFSLPFVKMFGSYATSLILKRGEIQGRAEVAWRVDPAPLVAHVARPHNVVAYEPMFRLSTASHITKVDTVDEPPGQHHVSQFVLSRKRA